MMNPEKHLYKFISLMVFLIVPLAGYPQEKLISVPFSQPDELDVYAGDDRTFAEGSSVILGNDLTVEGGKPEYEYIWQSPGEELIYSQTLTAQEPGIYHLRISDADNCAAYDSVSVSLITALPLRDTQPLLLYPNPSKETLHYYLRSSGGPVILQLFSSNGSMVYDQIFTAFPENRNVIIDLSGFFPGVYILRETGRGENINQVIIIQ